MNPKRTVRVRITSDVFVDFALTSETFSIDCCWMDYQTWCTTSELGNCCVGGSVCKTSGPKKLQLQHGKVWRRGNTALDDHWGLRSGELVQHQMALRRGRKMGRGIPWGFIPNRSAPVCGWTWGSWGTVTLTFFSQMLIASHIINFFLFKSCSLHWH